MNSKPHLIMSLIKSILRIIGCIALIADGNLFLFALCFLVAEVLGIAEEAGDNR